ncbi:MAG: glycosyltransferase family 39 protein, partial [Anaerolineae bacterium]
MSWSRLRYITLFGLVAVGFWMRLLYLKTSHPFFDEFTTILAGQEILRRGLPVLPSNLFYEHGLLFTYLDALALAVLGGTGQPAAGLSLEAGARWPSLLLGTLTIPVLYAVGRRWFNPWVGWLAAGLLALSPEGMVWGGRARMYTLATLLALLTAVLAYEGSVGPGRARLRRLALLALLATLLTHFGAMVMVGPLLVAVLVAARLTRPAACRSWLALNNWPELLSEGLG